jgi:2-oxoglutarate ferredoxin oxidoreductase subunit delta
MKKSFLVDTSTDEVYATKLPNEGPGRIHVKGRIEIDEERCKGCGLCITVCPKKQIEISDDLNTKGYYPAKFMEADKQEQDPTKCTGCALCAVTCPDVAIEVYREEKSDSKEEKNEPKEG